MRSADDLLEGLRAAGVTLWVDGGRLRYRAPVGTVNEEMRAALTYHRAAIMERLSGFANRADAPWSGLSDIPLSFTQEQIWVAQQLSSSSTPYVMPFAFQVIGPLNVPAMLQSIAGTIGRHHILRSSYPLEDGHPAVRMAESTRIPVHYVDLSRMPGDRQRALVQGLSRDAVRWVSDPSVGPPLVAVVARCAAADHAVVFAVHHIAFDGWSQRVFLRDLSVLYNRYSRGCASPAGESMPSQYADFARWQRRHDAEQPSDEHLAYWLQHLQGAAPLLLLPTDFPRPARQRYEGAVHRFPLSSDLVRKVRACARAHKVTPFTVLLAGYALLLSKYSNHEDIVIGCPVSQRNVPELLEVIGPLVNTIALRIHVNQQLRVDEFIAAVQRVVLDGLTHQSTPFSRLVSKLGAERNTAHSPVFQAMFSAVPQSTLDLSGLHCQEVSLPFVSSRVDVSLYWQDADDVAGSEMGIEYRTDLFLPEGIRRTASRLCATITGLTGPPEQVLGNISCLGIGEREGQLNQWNDTAVNQAESTLHGLVVAAALENPDAICLAFGDACITYHELIRRSGALAAHLRQTGVRRDVLVGVYMERSLEMVLAMLGILMAGGAYVPIDPSIPDERVAHILQDARPKMLLTQERFETACAKYGVPWYCLDPGLNPLPGRPDQQVSAGVSGGNLAYVIYTSGSTGRPKGVCISHEGIVNRLLWMQQAYRLSATDRVLQKTPIGFDVSLWELYWPLIAGACEVVAAPGDHRDSHTLAKQIIRHSVTTVHFVPSMLSVFLDEPLAKGCESLKWVLCSGEALSTSLADRCASLLPAALHNLYGPTEASVDVTYWPYRSGETRPGAPIGRPIANTQIHIVDHALQLQPVGVPGELHIGGVALARGYLNAPGRTAERFIPNPFGPPGSRLYRTGDRACYRADGNIDYLGRLDGQIKVRGQRVELGEIEAALCTHSEVKQAVVTYDNGPGGGQLRAFYVPQRTAGARDGCVAPTASGASPDVGAVARAIRQHLRNQLPEYMVPSVITPIASIPLTQNGKVDRRALLLRAPNSRPPGTPAAPNARGLPRKIAMLWAETVGANAIDVDLNFFDAGGDSLKLIELRNRIREEYGQEIPIDGMYDHPTIRLLARMLEERRARS